MANARLPLWLFLAFFHGFSSTETGVRAEWSPEMADRPPEGLAHLKIGIVVPVESSYQTWLDVDSIVHALMQPSTLRASHNTSWSFEVRTTECLFIHLLFWRHDVVDLGTA
jgi:hypothetical protein